MIDRWIWIFCINPIESAASLATIGLFWRFCGPRDNFWHRVAFWLRCRRIGFDRARYVEERFPNIAAILTEFPPTGEDIALVRDLAHSHRWKAAMAFNADSDDRQSQARLIARECHTLLERWG